MAKKTEAALPTGLPELPEGYFWRIGPREGHSASWGDGYTGFGIAIRRGRKRIYSSRAVECGNIESGILAEAHRIYQEWTSALARAATRRRLTGDYPPKTL